MEILKFIIAIQFIVALVYGIFFLFFYLFNNAFIPFKVYLIVSAITLFTCLLVVFVITPILEWFMNL